MDGETLDASPLDERDIPSVAGGNKSKIAVPLIAMALGAGVLFYQWGSTNLVEANTEATTDRHSDDYQPLDRDAFSDASAEVDAMAGTIPGDTLRLPPPPPPPPGNNGFPPNDFPPVEGGYQAPMSKEAQIAKMYASPEVSGNNGGGGSGTQRGNSEYRYPDQLAQLAQSEQRLQNQLVASLTQGGAAQDTRNPNTRFLDEVSNSPIERVQPTKMSNLQYLLQAGKLIHASLDTAMDSTLPGQVRATVSQNVYGAKGRVVLIPKGSQLDGEYRSAVARGQNRVFTAWNRILTPDGTNIPIGSAGADRLGRTGFQGEVDTHFWLRFREATLLSVLGAATANVGVNSASQPNSSDAYREAIATSFQVSSARALEENSQIPDTIFMDQGAEITVFTARDVDFSAVFQR